ncbi:hypothetical protein [Halolamina rubra]|uniref:hypothetical protein n=1 Tax=Halolamina rubra TaxID=1380430 RepID=UPI000ABF6EDB|nr:hypothetical protein [Halolamina rubra]
MAEFFVICGRNGTTDSYTTDDLETIADRILPSNAPRDVEIIRDDGVISCTINAPDSLPIHGASVCLGQMIPPREDWHEPGSPRPDGSYGIARIDTDSVELVADVTASRTLFYRLFDDLFVASTSQRAIQHFADEVVLDDVAIAWMISTGGLGPEQTWDERVEQVLPHGSVRLNRSTWELTEATQPATFEPTDEPKSVHHERLVTALDDTFEALELDTEHWELPLSGGLDSREILFRLCDYEGLRTITWGTDAALDHPESDAVRARELAAACDVDHRYYTIPETSDDVETVFERFVTAGEGRIDHISGYLDGFSVFADLANRGIGGLIRGDEGFGWKTVGSPMGVRQVTGAQMVEDYDAFSSLSVPGVRRQEFPKRLERTSGESLATWRDRLYHTYRLPVILGALTALKTPYIEVVNPFLTQRILETVRRLPDELRTEKQLYAEYVRGRSPDVPVATESANPNEEQFLKSDEAQAFLKSELDTDHARKVLGEDLIEYVLGDLKNENAYEKVTSKLTLDTIKRQVGNRLPKSIIRRVESNTPINRPAPTMSCSRLAFRLYIIDTMVNNLSHDADYL